MLTQMKQHEFDTVFELMEKAFPTTEMRIYEEQKKLLENEKYKIYTYRDEEGDIASFLAQWKLPSVYYIDHLAVNKNLRGQNIGSKILAEYLELVNGPVILEVEPPEGDLEKRRVAFYERNGFHLNTYPYLQPPLRKEHDFIPLEIMSYPQILDKVSFDKFAAQLYRFVYNQ